MPQKLNAVKELMIVLRKLKKLLSRKKTITFIMTLIMNLPPPNRLSPPSSLTFLHFSFLPTLSCLPVYLTSLSSPSYSSSYSFLPSLPIIHSTFPLYLSCTFLHFPSSSTHHLPATLSLSFFLSPLSSLSFPSSSSPLLPSPSLCLPPFPLPPCLLHCVLHHTP